jgi:uncharacterized protein YqgV (UPF0045/DUF77 family)
MDIGVELSLYPLRDGYLPVIEQFIARLQGHADLRVITNSMSTQIFGSYERVMALLGEQMRATFAEHGKAVFVMKVLGPLATSS